MNNKLPITTRGIFITAFMLLIAGLLATTPAQSAYPNAPDIATNLTLTKIMITDNGGTATQTNFQAKIDGGDVAWDTANPVAPDIQHTASEVAQVLGYTPSLWGGDCATDGTITLDLDTSGTCTITNDDIPPSLTITKLVNKDNGGSAVPADWTLTASGPTPISGAGGANSGSTFVAGTYTLSESAGPAGYTPGPWICTGDGTQVGNQITLDVGETASCTITNDDDVPSLTLSKTVITDNGGTAVAADWTLTASGPTPISGPGGAVSGALFEAGIYTLSESGGPTGYEASDWVCTGGIQDANQVTIALGESVSCSITNDDFARLTLVKNPTNDSGGTALEDDFLLTVGGLPVLSGEATEYPIDTPLAINETQLMGYEFVEITDDGSEKCPAVLGGTVTLALGDDITCTIVNDDVPAIKAVPDADLVTDENGTTDTFTVVLTTLPTAPVTITVSSSLPTEATVDPVVLNFTVGNWFTPQLVTVTGVNDDVADGDTPYLITLDPALSTATEYAALTPVQITGINFDNDIPGYIINPVDDLITTEGGGAQKVKISLRSKPTALVSMSLVSSDLTEGTVSPANLIIDPATWPQPAKEITITGVDDILVDGNIVYTVTITASSTDPDYSGPVDVLTVTNHDAPTIEWVKPVGDGEVYFVDSLSPILLEVASVGNEPISKVRFYRWVPSAGDWVTIGEDLTAPYQETIDPAELEFGWNEIRAFAFGPVPTLPGWIQTFSPHPLIFIYKDFGDNIIYLPMVYK